MLTGTGAPAGWQPPDPGRGYPGLVLPLVFAMVFAVLGVLSLRYGPVYDRYFLRRRYGDPLPEAVERHLASAQYKWVSHYGFAVACFGACALGVGAAIVR